MTSNRYSLRRARRPKALSRKEKGAIGYTIILIAALAAIAAYARYNDSRPQPSIQMDSAACLTHVVLPDETPEQLIEYTGFTVSFNAVHHQPNYVVWELTADKANGQTPRKSNFHPDPDVYGCATLDDYRRSGMDRGHMAPAGDMKWSQKAMEDSHVMTNICPQDHNVNGGRWSTIEKKCRQWAQRDSAIIIIAGPILSDEMPNTIGRSQVSVPERFFKVIISPYATPPTAIAFIVPNYPTDLGIEQMATTVDQIETITGFDFFSCLPDDIEAMVESENRFNHWNRTKR